MVEWVNELNKAALFIPLWVVLSFIGYCLIIWAWEYLPTRGYKDAHGFSIVSVFLGVVTGLVLFTIAAAEPHIILPNTDILYYWGMVYGVFATVVSAPITWHFLKKLPKTELGRWLMS